MDVTTSLLTLLHLLVMVYWLGGDLGAFYGSSFLTDPQRSVPERLMALKILNNVDMAPRTALILAFPTGLTLAWAKGWLAVPPLFLIAAGAGFLAWLALAWAVHLKHGPSGQNLKRADLALRYLIILALVAGSIAAMSGAVAVPVFIVVKMLILAVCFALGLVVRRQLVPIFPAVVQMRESGPTGGSDRVIADVISRTRPTVILLWLMILMAAYFGIATPV